MRKNTNIIFTINEFIEKYYPEANGVLLFGSASFKVEDFQDIDLLIIDEKFSYTSKTSIYNLVNNFSVIKISSYDIFNILAEDYKKGIYKNIFETGFIVKDEIKLLTFVKQYINENYPDDNKAVAYSINKCIFKINEAINSLKRKLPLTENFLIFSNLISFLIDFIILQDGKINFASSKHKSKYLHQYHLNESIKLNDIINTYKKDSEKAFVKTINFIEKINIPQLKDYYNDYLVESVDNIPSLVLYIPGAFDKDFHNSLWRYLSDLNIPFYSYWIDKNNIEESGFYFIIKNIGLDFFSNIKNKLKVFFQDNPFFFPYSIAFNQEIKFGGSDHYKMAEELFFEIQSIINSIINNRNKRLMFILFNINKMNITLNEVDTYYFYKTINNNHNLSIKDIIDKEKSYMMNIDNKQEKILLNSSQIKFDIEFDFYVLNKISKYFQIQIFDRILSMLFLNDAEKRQIIQLLRDQNFANV